MKTKISRWGNSVAIRIPKSILRMLSLKENEEVELLVEEEKIVIKPVTPGKYKLSELLEQITPENMHGEVDTDEPVGKEEW